MNRLWAGRRFYKHLTGDRVWWREARCPLRPAVRSCDLCMPGVPALQESPEHAGVPVDRGRLRVGHQELPLSRPQH